MMRPNTVPWPQPVVTVRLESFSSQPSVPLRVVTATEFTSQSTWMETMSSMSCTSPWFLR